jgi:SAM-dependent methyltransferase
VKLRDVNTDSSALGARASINASLAKVDLDAWIFANAELADGMTVLDLGCGLGKQVLYIAARLSPATRVLGLDISAESVEAVNRTALERGLAGVTARVLGLDECVAALAGPKFDRILSTYSIYYSSDMVKLLRSLAELLTPGGRLFVSGPGAGTNREIIECANRHAPDPESRLPDIGDFISPEQLASVAPAFSRCESLRLANSIRFPDADTVLTWWRQHASYRPSAEAGLAHELSETVAQQGHFLLTKNVLGVCLDV